MLSSILIHPSYQMLIIDDITRNISIYFIVDIISYLILHLKNIKMFKQHTQTQTHKKIFISAENTSNYLRSTWTLTAEWVKVHIVFEVPFWETLEKRTPQVLSEQCDVFLRSPPGLLILQSWLSVFSLAGLFGQLFISKVNYGR